MVASLKAPGVYWVQGWRKKKNDGNLKMRQRQVESGQLECIRTQHWATGDNSREAAETCGSSSAQLSAAVSGTCMLRAVGGT